MRNPKLTVWLAQNFVKIVSQRQLRNLEQILYCIIYD